MTAKAAKLLRILRVADWRAALRRHRVVAGVEHAVVLRQFNGCRAVVDIGANRGQFALAARHVFPDARIDSFEPLPAPAAIFSKVFAGDGRVRLHPYAVASTSGKAPIHVSARDDSSSLLPIGSEQDRIFPGTAEVAIAHIEMRRLEDVLQRADIAAPALLKLDVQGYELQALRGCETLLDAFAWVYCECSFVELYEGQALADEVIAWLRERGFGLLGAYNMAFDHAGRAVQADFLFGRREQEQERDSLLRSE
ncbi:FkbM family methyltransferase [Metallibacterium scheffleri]|uniref:Methyltransferase FkbM n=1 Tax=Metallibacterium scheffleri TaxID=993689 RepID=A0A4S3KMA1_9GAMM|nr:FkbM family methyltransferase [Metallibacterium scheffleri]THD09548.1 methyltransferase FkbM [Metallibacterium scheffleri]